MSTADLTDQRLPHTRNAAQGWKPGAWTVALVLAWLLLLSVPTVWLFNIDGAGPSAPTPEAPLKPWMPIPPPII